MKLEVREIVKSFSGKEILHAISFEVESGKAMGFLGRNGAGKTTTIRCLMDVFKQDSGHFYLNGKEFDVNSVNIGYLPEERGMYQKISILDQLVYFSKLRGATHRDAVESSNYWIDRFDLSDYKKKNLETLSKGNQQKIQIAQAFLNNPEILILDEPFSGLDPINSEIFKEVIREFVNDNKLVIFSSHQMSYVEEMCDDVTLIENGHILVNQDLASLKRQYGENRVLLTADNFSNDELVHKLSDFSPEINRNGLVLNTRGQTHSQFLEYLLQNNIEIGKYGYFEPSLQDLFVKIVGEFNE